MPENLLQTITIKPRGVESTRKKVAGLFAAFREGADEATEAGDSVLGRIKGIGKSAKVWIAGVAVSAIAALTAGLAKAASTAIKFEENLQKVGTLIDGDVTGTLDRFAEGLDRIRQQLPVTTDLTRALYDAISAGIPEENAIGFLDDAARAATAGMTDTKTAVDALTSALNAYGKEVEETEEISDSFFQAIEAGKTTFPELASEMGKVLPLASSLGVEIDEVNAALATLTASGRSTSEAGTELRQILNSLIKEGERFRSVGIDINEVLDERGLFGVLQRVREETGGSSQEMRKLFRRVQALNGAITLGVENNQKFADTLGLMEEKAGATDEAVQQMEKSVSSLWQTTRNQLSTLWRQLGEDVLPALNSALRATVGLLDDASSTDLDRLIQTVSEMQGIDSGVEERLRAVRRLRRAEERVEEARGDRQGEIVTGVDLSTRPSTLRRGELSEMNVEELRSRLQAVNEALAERANRVAELEAKEGDLSEVQQQTLDMARRRRSLLETARKGLLEGIETLTRYEAAQKAVTQARQDLNDALSEDPAAQSGGGESAAVGAGEPSLLQRLSGIENVDELDPATQKAIGDWVEALQSNLEGEVKAMQQAAGIGDTGLLGVDVEEMVSRIEEQRKRLEQGEINPAQFAEEAGAIAKEYRTEIETIIDRTVQLTTLSEEAGRRMKQGLKPARDEAQALRSEYIQRVGDLQARGEISAETAEEIAKAIESMSDEALKAAGSFDEVLKRLSETNEISEDTFSAAQDALEHLTGETEEWGKAMQDAARFVRGIGDLADQFGDLSDEAEAAIDSTATVLDNVGRLVELSKDAEGFSNIFSSFSGAVSGVSAILGAAGGIASMVQTLAGDNGPGEERIKELRQEMNENTRALRKNTEALFDQSVVGGDVSEEAVDTVESALQTIREQTTDLQNMFNVETDLSETEVLDLFGQIEETGIEAFQDITDTFKNLRDRGLPVSKALRRVVTGDLIDFEGIESIFERLKDNFGEFGQSLQGLISEIKIRRDQLGESVQSLTDVIVRKLENVGFDAPLTHALEKMLSNLDLKDEQAVQDFLDQLTKFFVGDISPEEFTSRFRAGRRLTEELDELLGDVSPNEFQKFVDMLRSTLTGAGGQQDEGQFTTQAAISRTITEHDANQLLAFQRELVQLGRTQRDLLSAILASLGGKPPESPPASGSSSASQAPPASEAPSGPGVGIPADLQETIAAAEANGFRPPDVGRQQQLRKKVVNQGQTNYIDINISGEMSAERTARKVRQYLDEYLPRG